MNVHAAPPVLALAFLLAGSPLPPHSAAASQQVTGAIRGQVFGRLELGVSPLSGALIHLSLGSRNLTVMADEAGGYSARGLAPGRWRLRALHVGYEEMTVEVQVPAGDPVTLDLELRGKPIVLPAITVRGDPLRGVSGKGPPPLREVGEVAMRALEGSTGMVEAGIAQVARGMPGQDPADPSDILLMRGSASDLKLVLLDGAPLYTPFHMAGLVESFDPTTLGGASLFLGGAPARFDGGLSYILDLRARSPRRDRVQGRVALDLLTGRALMEGPLTSSTAFLVAGRAIHDLGTPLLGRGTSPYGYGDLLARVEWAGEGGGAAFLTAFWNEEDVRLDLPPREEQVLDWEGVSEEKALLAAVGEDAALWGNRAVSAGFRKDFGEARGELRVAASRYDASLPVGDSLPLFATGRSGRLRLTADFSRPWGEGALRFGGSLDRLLSSYEAQALDTAQGAPPGRSLLTRFHQDGVTGGAYLEAEQPLGGSFRLRAGFRVDRYSGDSGIHPAPRLALSWVLTDAAILTVAGGRYHQFANLQSREIEEGLDPGNTSLGGSRSPSLPMVVGSADHLVVSLDQLLGPSLRLGLEGFVKEFHGVSGGAEESLNASGVELRVAREGERASGWLGYTLTWFWAEGGILASGRSPFSGRHLLSAGLVTPITSRTGLRLRAGYGDGLPYTSVPVLRDATEPAFDTSTEMAMEGDKVLNEAPGLAMGPDEGFLRLEAEIFGFWSPRFRGRTMELRPYLRVLNALNRRDALFYHFDPWRQGGPEPLAELPVLPLVGLEWRF